MTPSVSPKGTRALACMLALMLAPSVQAQGPEDPAPPDTEAESPVSTPAPAPSEADAEAPPWKTRFGVKLDAGAPGGVGASALVHPWRWFRAHAGAAKNSLGFGARGGVSLTPLELFVSPSLELEYGHYFNADYGKLLTQLHGQPTTPTTSIREVGYDQASASVGLELSPSPYVTLFGNVGISYWSIRVNDVRTFIRDAENDSGISSKPLTLSLTSPAVKLGLIVYVN